MKICFPVGKIEHTNPLDRLSLESRSLTSVQWFQARLQSVSPTLRPDTQYRDSHVPVKMQKNVFHCVRRGVSTLTVTFKSRMDLFKWRRIIISVSISES
jgi:hypothetical protein